MEPITIGIIAAIGAGWFGYDRYNNHKYKKIVEKEKGAMGYFIEDVINNKVVFRKVNAGIGFGIVTNSYQATDANFYINVRVSANEIEFVLYSENMGKVKNYFTYVYERKMKTGQIIENNDREFVRLFEKQINALIEKIINYQWENPVSYIAKETLKIFKNPLQSFEKESSFPSQPAVQLSQVEKHMQQVEHLYFSMKEDVATHFDLESQHHVERLYETDFKKLIDSYHSIKQKTPQDEQNMLHSLSSIYGALKKYEEKLDGIRKQTFQRNVEIINKRDK